MRRRRDEKCHGKGRPGCGLPPGIRRPSRQGKKTRLQTRRESKELSCEQNGSFARFRGTDGKASERRHRDGGQRRRYPACSGRTARDPLFPGAAMYHHLSSPRWRYKAAHSRGIFHRTAGAGKRQHKAMQRKGGERVNKMKITIEIGGTKREVYCFQREEDFLTVLSVRKCTGYSPLTYRCTLATVLHLWWQGMLEKIGISDR